MKDSHKIGLAALYFFLAVSAIGCILRWGMTGKALSAYIFLVFLGAAALKDLHTMHIPDYIVFGTGIAGMLSVPFFPEIGLVSRGIGMICVSILLLLIALVRPGSFGGGDIKLMAASGMFLGWERNYQAFALAVFLAGVYCIWKLARGKLSAKESIAFGPFLCAGVIAAAFM